MIGRRPNGFYEELLNHKNLVLLKTEELGLDCIRQSKAVATISGTAGLEACVIGRPVITFKRHNIYNISEDVQIVIDDTDLWPIFKKIFRSSSDAQSIRQRGRRLLSAVRKSSWDMAGFDYSNQKVFDQKQVDDCYMALLASLDKKFAEPQSY